MEYICGYRPYPPNYNSWLSPLHAERLRRLDRKITFKFKLEKRPMLIVLHLFADDLDQLRHWLDMIYEVASPDLFGKQIEFLVDDIWASYIFELNMHSIKRCDSSYSTQSAPLIYGVTAAGEVYFFGNAQGPQRPSLRKLQSFCKQLLSESLVQHLKVEDKCQVPEVDLNSFNELIYGEYDADIILCFYTTLQGGADESNRFMEDIQGLAGKLKQEKVKIFKMNLQTCQAPKNFNIQRVPTMFVLRRAQRLKPICCYDIHGVDAMIRYIAPHFSDNLYFYDRDGKRKLHAELLWRIQYYFKEENTNSLRYLN